MKKTKSDVNRLRDFSSLFDKQGLIAPSILTLSIDFVGYQLLAIHYIGIFSPSGIFLRFFSYLSKKTEKEARHSNN